MEAMLIAKHVVDTTTTVNKYHPESLFIKSFDLPQKWSDLISFHKNAERSDIEDMPCSRGNSVLAVLASLIAESR